MKSQTPGPSDAKSAASGTPSFVSEFLEAWTKVPRAAAVGPYRILDVGAGTARIPIALCRSRADLEIVAVDRRAAHKASERVYEAGLESRISLIRADGQALPFRDAMFDAVISNGLVHHLTDPVAVLREMRRVLCPGGLLLVRDSLRLSDADSITRVLSRSADADAPRPKRQSPLTAPLTLADVRRVLVAGGLSAEWLTLSGPAHWTVCQR